MRTHLKKSVIFSLLTYQTLFATTLLSPACKQSLFFVGVGKISSENVSDVYFQLLNSSSIDISPQLIEAIEKGGDPFHIPDSVNMKSDSLRVALKQFRELLVEYTNETSPYHKEILEALKQRRMTVTSQEGKQNTTDELSSISPFKTFSIPNNLKPIDMQRTFLSHSGKWFIADQSLWNTKTGMQGPPLEGLQVVGRHRRSIANAIFHPNGKEVSLAFNIPGYGVWSLETGKFLRGNLDVDSVLNFGDRGDRIVLLPNGVLASTRRSANTATFLDSNGKETTHSFWQNSSRFSKSVFGRNWLMQKINPPRRFGYQDNGVERWNDPVHLIGSVDSPILFALSQDGSLEAYDTTQQKTLFSTGSIFKNLYNRPEQAIFLPEANQIFFQINNDRFMFWDTVTKKNVDSDSKNRTQIRNSWEEIVYREISHDGRYQAVTKKYPAGTVEIWDIETQTLKTVITNENQNIRQLAFSSDGKLLSMYSTNEQKVMSVVLNDLF